MKSWLRERERESHEEAGEELAKRESLTRKLVRSSRGSW